MPARGSPPRPRIRLTCLERQAWPQCAAFAQQPFDHGFVGDRARGESHLERYEAVELEMSREQDDAHAAFRQRGRRRGTFPQRLPPTTIAVLAEMGAGLEMGRLEAEKSASWRSEGVGERPKKSSKRGHFGGRAPQVVDATGGGPPEEYQMHERDKQAPPQ